MASDPQPAWRTDGCGGGGFNFFFSENEAELDDFTLTGRLSAMAALWRGDRGAILIAGHADLTEPDQSGLDRRRAESVRDALVARGIPVETIWLRGQGTSAAYGSQAGPPLPEPQNRRAEVFSTGRSERCIEERRTAIRAWFERNCFPERRAGLASCQRALQRIQSGSES